MKTVRTIARHSFGLSLALIALICGFTLSAYAQGAKPSWTFTGSLNIPRHHHTATLLKTGKVLVAGGGTNGSDVLNSAELYDPAIGVWSVTGHLITARTGHTATLLQNGKVLVAGGRSSASVADDLTGAELYDPDTGTWSITGNLNLRRFNHTATRLQDGKVLVVGGGVNEHSPTAELYDPETGTWSVTVLNLALDNHRATLLPDGVVLVTGGWDENDRNWPTDNSPLNSAERYEPRTGLWSNTGELLTARVNHTATLLANGRVLVAAGDDG